MSQDPLAAFRRAQSDSQPNSGQQKMTSQQTTGLKPYKAWSKNVKRKVECLVIEQVLAPWTAPEYRYYQTMWYDGNYGTQLTLIFSFQIIKIEGRNLNAIRDDIQDHACEAIRDFHPNEYAQPAPNEPVITKIEFIVGEEFERMFYKPLDQAMKEHRSRNGQV